MDISTLALNMTFLMTLGIGFLMFLAHVLMCATVLLLAGAARFAALTFTALWNRLRMAEGPSYRSRPHRETRPASVYPEPGLRRLSDTATAVPRQ
ncbi:MAG: hypothetical protein JWN19_2732 [Arthrobacter sp.]|jgi:hypothetical protein|nr:hypothetical protein [Arthrobacter sp.]